MMWVTLDTVELSRVLGDSLSNFCIQMGCQVLGIEV